MSREIQGNKPNTHLQDESMRALANGVSASYDADEFAIGIVTKQSLKGRGGSTLFINLDRAQHVSIRSDQDITVRFNLDTNPPITVDAGIPFEPATLEITDIYVTTAAASTNLRVMLT
jgi:hypothetical protein